MAMIRQRPRRVAVVALAFLVLPGIAACRKITAPSAAGPPSAASVLPPPPSDVATSSPTSDGAPQPRGDSPYFVVGEDGIGGPTVVQAGTDLFTITNNATVPHAFDLVRVTGGTSADRLRLALHRGGGAWPPDGVRVVVHSPTLSPRQTVTVRTEPLQEGDYFLVDVATDGAKGKPFGVRAPYALAIQVVPLSS
jgi:hypothetical protein